MLHETLIDKIDRLKAAGLSEVAAAIKAQCQIEMDKKGGEYFARINSLDRHLDLTEILIRLFDWGRSERGIPYWNEAYRQLEALEFSLVMQSGGENGYVEHSLRPEVQRELEKRAASVDKQEASSVAAA